MAVYMVSTVSLPTGVSIDGGIHGFNSISTYWCKY